MTSLNKELLISSISKPISVYITIKVNDSSKQYGDDDPISYNGFTVEPAEYSEEFLKSVDIIVIRNNSDVEDPGVYEEVLDASIIDNPSYTSEIEFVIGPVQKGTFTIFG